MAVALLVGFQAVSFAADIQLLEVEREDGRVRIDSHMLIVAPRAAVFDALADYERFSELSDRYLESEFMPLDFDGTPRIYTKVEGCVLFFCRTIKRFARLELTPHSQIVALVDAQLSDLDFGFERWELSETPEGTLVKYRHELEPSFWVPPVIGVWAIERILKNDALTAASRIERMAKNQNEDIQE